MVELDIRGVQLCCLAIAKEFAKICEKHNIPYYMLGGTMLGAIRHKGFIPWDDDMDFGVPYEYYDELISLLKEELPEPYKCSTYKDSKCVFFPFFKIEDTTTVLNDMQLPVPIDEKIGVNIDVFPLIHCQPTSELYPTIWKTTRRSGALYANSRTHKLTNVCKSIIRTVWPISKVQYIDRVFNLFENVEKGPYLGNICGRWRIKEVVPIEWYGEKCTFPFEDTCFVGIQEYDKYLKQLYGDYMKLPPADQQFVHSANAFKK